MRSASMLAVLPNLKACSEQLGARGHTDESDCSLSARFLHNWTPQVQQGWLMTFQTERSRFGRDAKALAKVHHRTAYYMAATLASTCFCLCCLLQVQGATQTGLSTI